MMRLRAPGVHAGSRRRRTGGLLALVSFCVWIAPAASARQEPVSADLRLEGALRNDSFQPVSAAASEELLAGDRAWSRAAAGGAGARDERSRAFEAWYRALNASSDGDAVRLAPVDGPRAFAWPDPDQTHDRRTEDVAYAVLRRLSSATPDERGEWRTRFETLASGALEEAPTHAPALADVERAHPFTRSAAIAALRLADGAFEENRIADARLWLERLERHLLDIEGEQRAAWDARIERRRAACTRDDRPAPATETWRSASDFTLERTQRLESTRKRPGHGMRGPLGLGLEPGLAFLDDGSFAIQTPRTLVWFDARAAGTRTGGTIARFVFAELIDVPSVRPVAAPSSGGWPLLPATDGQSLVVVVDRGRPGYKMRNVPIAAYGNHLVHMRIDGEGRSVVHWTLSARGLERSNLPPRDAAEILGPGTWQFQPGPLLIDGVVFVLARLLPEPEGPGAERGGDAWLFALDARAGELRWARLITKGSDLKSDSSARRGPGSSVPTAGMPLAHVRGRVVACTNLGIAAAFDAADGRQCWSLRTRRRDVDDPGWPGSRRPSPEAGSDRPRAVVLGPFDSDFLYSFHAIPDLARGGLYASPPVPIGDAADWTGFTGSAEASLVTLGRDGRHRALRLRNGAGEVRSSLYLGSEEHFAGRGLTSNDRLWLASDQNLFLLDFERDLFLLAAQAIPDLGGGLGGTPYGRGDRLVLVGPDTVWIWRVE
ncbi:MAG: PQQ-like beta-propeller repeat protein [bacterium]|nr:PQQ-like beta-propeller repeat protein [bacterium]